MSLKCICFFSFVNWNNVQTADVWQRHVEGVSEGRDSGGVAYKTLVLKAQKILEKESNNYTGF